MGKSINPMWRSFNAQGEAFAGSAPGPIVLMSLQSAIPWRVALQQSPPPLHRLDSIYHSPAETVNHHLTRAGEFSTGIMRNFQLVLTRPAPSPFRPRMYDRTISEDFGLYHKYNPRARPSAGNPATPSNKLKINRYFTPPTAGATRY